MTSNKPSFPIRSTAVGALVTAAGIMAADLPAPLDAPAPWTIAGGGLLAAGAVGRYVLKRGSTRGLIGRWTNKADRNDSTASWLDITRTSSAWAMRRRAATLAPSLANRAERRDVARYSKVICRVGRRPIRISCEETELILGATRMGKTEAAASRILDAAGAVVATSTRLDIVELTRSLRERQGPVLIFNPSGLGGVATTIKFDPLAGCRSIKVATQRAADLVGTAPSGSTVEQWLGQSRRTLATLLHAAALGDQSIREVLSWVANPDAYMSTVYRLLDRSPQADAVRADAAAFFELHEGGKRSITMSTMPALSWVTDPVAASVAEPGPDEQFDVAEFIRLGGTLYLLGAKEGNVAPLVSALTSHIWREAKRIAAGLPGSRLDPYLTLVLDEAYLICPVPLDEWTAEAGGWNIQMHMIAQSLSQLRERWGENGAEIILDNTNVLTAFGGIKSSRNLEELSKQSGTRQEVVETRNADGEVVSRTTRPVPVVSTAQLSDLPQGSVMVKRRGMPVALGRTVMTSKRRDVVAARRTASPLVLSTNYEAQLLEEDAR